MPVKQFQRALRAEADRRYGVGNWKTVTVVFLLDRDGDAETVIVHAEGSGEAASVVVEDTAPKLKKKA